MPITYSRADRGLSQSDVKGFKQDEDSGQGGEQGPTDEEGRGVRRRFSAHAASIQNETDQHEDH